MLAGSPLRRMYSSKDSARSSALPAHYSTRFKRLQFVVIDPPLVRAVVVVVAFDLAGTNFVWSGDSGSSTRACRVGINCDSCCHRNLRYRAIQIDPNCPWYCSCCSVTSRLSGYPWGPARLRYVMRDDISHASGLFIWQRCWELEDIEIFKHV